MTRVTATSPAGQPSSGAAALARLAATSTPPVTLADALAILSAAFRDAGLDTAGLDARRLVAGTLGREDVELLRAPETVVADAGRQALLAAAHRRLAREPVSRILALRHFYGLALEVGPATLDPRPDTETLVDGVLALVADGRVPGGAAPRILDLGTGTGAILIALLAALPEAHGTGTDRSPEALEIARRNAARHALANRATFLQSDWLDAVTGQFDLIVSNPPYIASGDIAALDPEVRDHDPHLALDGGQTGLEAYAAIARGLAGTLAPGGWIAVEFGAGQHDDVAALLRQHAAGRELMTEPYWLDLSQTPRCVAAKALR